MSLQLDPVSNDEDWQAGKSLHEAMEHLFVYKVGADVTFTVKHEDGPSKWVQ